MKLKLNSMLLPMAAALMLVGCQDLMSDGGGLSNPEDDGRVVYLSTTIALPTATGTRSGTDNTVNGEYDGSDPDADEKDRTNSNENKNDRDDFEYGYDYENDVQSMILLIANEDGKYISHSVVKSIMQAPDGNTNFTFTVTAEIKHSDLAAAYGSGRLLDSDNSTVNLYAYCNYTTSLLEDLNGLKSGDDKWQDFTGKVEEGASPVGHTPEIPHTIWAPRSFLMTNASKFDTKFPGTIEDWSEHADPSNPFDANAASKTTPNKPIRVERAAARIDFRAADGITDNTYRLEVALSDKTDAQKLNLFSVQLTRMALVNMSKEFYYLRRVSGNGLNTGSTIGGAEWFIPASTGTLASGNYVVDSDADAKNAIRSSNSSDEERAAGAGEITPGNADKHFNFTLFKSAQVDGKYPYNIEGWYADKIETVLDGAKDTWSGSGTSNPYHIWRYVTENTIPKPLDNQQTVQSTGVIFKGSIIAGTDVHEKYTESGSDVDPVRYASPEVELALKAAAKHLTHDRNATDINTVGDLEGKGVDDKFNYPILYSYDGLLYAGVDDLVEAAVRAAERSPLYDAVEKVLNHWYLSYDLPSSDEDNITGEFTYYAKEPEKENGEELQKLTVAIYNDILKNKGVAKAEQKAGNSGFGLCTVAAFGTTDEPEEFFMKHAPEKGSEITIYKASEEVDGEGWGYYCYYFYWNRHNDNLKSGEMGIMEFATVRNNVYKLSVTGIGKLGHPRIPAYDPDPVDPNDPDEEPVNYLKVQVEVLPWVVRVNDIKF